VVSEPPVATVKVGEAEPLHDVSDAAHIRLERPGRRGGAVLGGDDGHAGPETLFSVDTRFIPNRTRRDGSALVNRMDVREARTETKEG
jgi:hypothetical protein